MTFKLLFAWKRKTLNEIENVFSVWENV